MYWCFLIPWEIYQGLIIERLNVEPMRLSKEEMSLQGKVQYCNTEKGKKYTDLLSNKDTNST